MATESLLLKWGSLKGWNLDEDGKAFAAFKKYVDLGMSMSAAMQRDTPEQKALLCEIIDHVDGPIKNDWSGEEMTPAQAKEYVNEYGK